ncbi:MAG: hypothetical protein LBU62_07205 [Bacteroidales bacterium]|nr:hypothetical protein [Bacteroidales bacterium]
MNKYSFYILFFVLTVSCGQKKATKDFVRMSPDEVLFTQQAGEQAITVRADSSWQISSDQPWVQLSASKGEPGRSMITVAVPEYAGGTSERTAKLTIIAGGNPQIIHVMQSHECLALSSAAITLGDAAGGDKKTLIVRGDSAWQISSDCPWLSLSAQGGDANRQVSVSLAAPINTEVDERSGSIFISMGGEVIRKVTVKQEKANDILVLVDCDTIALSDLGKYRVYKVAASSNWKAAATTDWISISPAAGGAGITKVQISAKENDSQAERSANLAFTMNGTAKEIPLKQGVKGNYWNDGEVLTLHRHTRGEGVPVVLIGDGFDREDLKKGGWWETKAREQVDSFLFKNCIVCDFKDLFDVHIYMAESPERGVYSEHKNRFGSGQPEINFDGAMALINQTDIIRKVPGMEPGFSTIFIGNGMVGGYAWFEYRMGVYSTDEPPSIYWTAHEFVGHAFTGLADEYGGNGTYMTRKEIDLYQSQNKCLNISVTDNLKLVPWKDFVGQEGYEEVGAFEGGFYADKGVWRPEKHSVMVGWTPEQNVTGPYYNAMSRWMIYREILTQASVPFTFDDFLVFDKRYNVK